MEARVFGLLAILAISVIPLADAQFSVGEEAQQKSVEVTMNDQGNVHVKHVIMPSNTHRQLDFINGTVSNFSFSDNEGNVLADNGEAFVKISDKSIIILPSKNNSIVEYDLGDVLSQINGVWTWNFLYLQTTSFIFPDNAELIYANERPVYLDDKKGIACHGCQMVLEFSLDEPKKIEDVKWEDKQFDVEIRSHADIQRFAFDQPNKTISFDVSEGDKFVTTIIPQELLWGPYAVFLDDEKIFFHDYINNGTHVWLNMKPDNSGKITIVGTTAVPEFPIIAPLAVGFLMIAILPLLKKINHR